MMLNAQEVKDMYAGWVSALMNGSVKALEVICDVDFLWTNSAGETRTKAQLMQGADSDELIYESWTSDSHRVRFYGNTAVLTCRDHLNVIVQGNSSSLEQETIAVFFRQDNSAWKLVSTQSTGFAVEGN